jgi:hypothetical protein
MNDISIETIPMQTAISDPMVRCTAVPSDMFLNNFGLNISPLFSHRNAMANTIFMDQD